MAIIIVGCSCGARAAVILEECAQNCYRCATHNLTTGKCLECVYDSAYCVMDVCEDGWVWDNNQGKCVQMGAVVEPECLDGYYWDSSLGKCVEDAVEVEMCEIGWYYDDMAGMCAQCPEMENLISKTPDACGLFSDNSLLTGASGINGCYYLAQHTDIVNMQLTVTTCAYTDTTGTFELNNNCFYSQN